MYLLLTDLHLDDNPDNEYRWQIFDRVNEVRASREVSRVFCLGDMFDRKDRHSAAFVNRLFTELDPDWIILRGNHDTPMRPPAYFEFIPNYVTEPTGYDGRLCDVEQLGARLLLLPFTPNPREDWKAIDMRAFDCMFMHQTVTGAVVDNGIVLENPNFPLLPPGLKVYSGDIHHPQKVGTVTYVGAPHPTKYGDDYHCRMLLLDEQTFDIVQEIPLDPPQKLMLDIASLDDLVKLEVRPGDRVKLRFNLKPGTVDTAPDLAARIAEWAKAYGVTVTGTEVVVNAPLARGVDTNKTPEAILREFAQHEKLSEEMLKIGLELLKEVA